MRTFVTRLALALLVAGLILPRSTTAQTPVPEVANQAPVAGNPGLPESQDPQMNAMTAEALQSLARVLEEKRAEHAKAVAERNQTAITALDQEIRELRWQFAGLVTRIDVQKFEAPSSAKFDLQGEIIDTVRPLVAAIKDATAGLSQKMELRAQIATTVSRIDVAEAAKERLNDTIIALKRLPTSPGNTLAIEETQLEFQKHWLPLLRSLRNQKVVLDEKKRVLDEAATTTSWWDTISGAIGGEAKDGLNKKGMSVVWGGVAFAATYFLMRFLCNLVLRRKRDRGFTARLAEVLLQMLTVIAAIAAVLIVLHARDEIVMLTIGIIFVIGAGWVIAKSAAQFLEQFRLILNIGAVREGERLIVDGLPYRVEALRFYSKLNNPALTGGTLRIPIGHLIGQRSRRGGKDEPWFPCQQGDVVMINDLIGTVELQTPETVIFVNRNDAPRSIPTADFLAMNPRNLSHGFLLTVTFGIDYSHQGDAIQRVPQLFHAAIQQGLAQDPDADAVLSVKVELSTAGSSSLDFLVLVNLAGKAAIRHNPLKRKINQALVAACTEHGFGIPFPQLQVHGIKTA